MTNGGQLRPISQVNSVVSISLLQELQEVGAQQNPKMKELRDRLGKALVELQAAKEEDGVVVSRLHKDGSAFHSGQVSNGDIISRVDETPVGQSLSVPLNTLAVADRKQTASCDQTRTETVQTRRVQPAYKPAICFAAGGVCTKYATFALR
jgi:hypothetical protein